MTTTEAKKRLRTLPDWKLVEKGGVPRIAREFKFREFADAMGFAVQVGMLVERLDHHPAVTVEWGQATVEFWTHKVNGLHGKDFEAAAKVDQLYEG